MALSGKACGCRCVGSCSGDGCKCNKSSRKHVAIVIDGYGHCGKTSLAKELASRFGYVYMSMNLFLQAFAIHKLWLVKELTEEDSGSATVTNMMALNTFDVDFRVENGKQVIEVCGQDVSGYLNASEVSEEVHNIVSDKEATASLIEYLRKRCSLMDVVLDSLGVDFLSDAQVKIYLIALLETRAVRCYNVLQARNIHVTMCSVMDSLRAEDTRQYDIVPGLPCDIECLDNSDLTLSETVDAVVRLVKLKVGDVDGQTA